MATPVLGLLTETHQASDECFAQFSFEITSLNGIRGQPGTRVCIAPLVAAVVMFWLSVFNGFTLVLYRVYT